MSSGGDGGRGPGQPKDYIKLMGGWAPARCCTLHFPSRRKGLIMKEAVETLPLESFSLIDLHAHMTLGGKNPSQDSCEVYPCEGPYVKK